MVRKNGIVDIKKNALDIFRIMAAIQVMLGHFMWKYEGVDKTNLINSVLQRIISIYPGVVVLFAISGFVICASCERNSSKQYIYKRIVRLCPPYYVATFMNILIVLCLVPHLIDQSFLKWIITQLFMIANTPACLKSWATGSINGSLWTIMVEVQLYIVAFISMRLLKRFHLNLSIGLVVGALVLNIVSGVMVVTDMSTLISRTFIPYFIWFAVGMYVYVQKDIVIPKLVKWCYPMIAIYTIYFLVRAFTEVTLHGYYADIMVSCLLPFIVLGWGLNCGNGI